MTNTNEELVAVYSLEPALDVAALWSAYLNNALRAQCATIAISPDDVHALLSLRLIAQTQAQLRGSRNTAEQLDMNFGAN